MQRNQKNDAEEFRQMVEGDVAWFFKLLLLSPNLRLLLIFGPIVGANLRPEGLFRFLVEAAPAHGFKVCQEGQMWRLWHETTGKVLFAHDSDTPGDKSITSRVVKNLDLHRQTLRRLLISE